MRSLLSHLPRQLIYFGLFLVALTLLLGGFVVYNYRYYPAVVAAPGYTITTPTQPGNLLSGSIMRLRADLELGGPCQYHLSGWSEDNILYCQVAPYNVPGSCGNNAPLSCTNNVPPFCGHNAPPLTRWA
jgi:hypothetical protein